MINLLGTRQAVTIIRGRKQRKHTCTIQVEEVRAEGDAAVQEKAAAQTKLQEEVEALKVAHATQIAQLQTNTEALEKSRNDFDAQCKELVEKEAARVREEEARAREYALEAVKAAHETEISRVKEDLEHLYASKAARLQEAVVGIFSHEFNGNSTVSKSAHVEVASTDV